MIIDTAFILYCLFGALRGRRRKLSGMLYRLLRMAVAVFAGVSLFKMIGRLLSHFMGTFYSEPLGFILALMLPLISMHAFRRSLSNWIEGRIGRKNESTWGAVVGFSHSIIVASALLITLSLSEKSYLYDTLSRSSLLVRLYRFVLNMF